MPCGPPFFLARNDGVMQAAHNGAVALALCMQVTPLHVGVNVVSQDSEFIMCTTCHTCATRVLTMNATKDCKYELSTVPKTYTISTN